MIAATKEAGSRPVSIFSGTNGQYAGTNGRPASQKKHIGTATQQFGGAKPTTNARALRLQLGRSATVWCAQNWRTNQGSNGTSAELIADPAAQKLDFGAIRSAYQKLQNRNQNPAFNPDLVTITALCTSLQFLAHPLR